MVFKFGKLLTEISFKAEKFTIFVVILKLLLKMKAHLENISLLKILLT